MYTLVSVLFTVPTAAQPGLLVEAAYGALGRTCSGVSPGVCEEVELWTQKLEEQATPRILGPYNPSQGCDPPAPLQGCLSHPQKNVLPQTASAIGPGSALGSLALGQAEEEPGWGSAPAKRSTNPWKTVSQAILSSWASALAG